MDRPLGARISHMLKDRGVRHVFGIPGVHNQEMYRGIEEAGLTHILARHEQGAGFMADGYARATGRPGVCYVITGPGLCNIMTPMGQAYSDSVPMLVISSCLDETAATRGQLHQMKDQRAAADTVCDWSEEARTAEAACALIDRALSEFTSRRARPRHIQVPISVLQGPAPKAWDHPGHLAVARPRPSPDEIDTVAGMIRRARRPLAIFGGGAVSAVDAAREAVARLKLASFVTSAGRGIVAPDDPLFFGSMLARPESAKVFAEADLVLLLGTDLAEVDLWRDAAGHSCPAVIVNLDSEVLARGAGTDCRVLADCKEFLETLCRELPQHPADVAWTAVDVAAIRTRWRAEVAAEYHGVLPVADALRDCLPENAMIYSDMTQFAYAALEVWDMDRPGHWHHPNGFGTLGYALPAAIGGAVGRPGRPTLAIAGDYGFQYTVQELATAVELGLSLPILLWDNGKLGAIEDSMVRAQIAPNAVVQRNPDFLKLADAYGARAAQPGSLSEMQETVRAAFDAGLPTVIRVTQDIASA